MSKLAPSKLTVRIVKRTLGDHYLDFMNANNAKGFMQDEDKEIDENTLSGRLIAIAVSPTFKKLDLRKEKKHLYELSGQFVPKPVCSKFIAMALGYSSVTEARDSAVDGVIVNRRLTLREAATDIVAEAKHGVDFRDWPLDKPLPDRYTCKNVIDGIVIGPEPKVKLPYALGTLPYTLVTWTEAQDLLELIHESPAYRQIMRWLEDQDRNVPFGQLVWVSYQGRGRYFPRGVLTQLGRRFHKRGGTKWLSRLHPEHPFAQFYVPPVE